jgi:hypothetical protein
VVHRPGDALSQAGEPSGAHDPPNPPPDPFAPLTTRPARIVGQSLDLLTQSAGELRIGSLYIGLLVLLGAAPMALLTWRITQDVVAITLTPPGRLGLLVSGLEDYFNLTVVIAAVAAFVALLESRAIATSILAGRLSGDGLALEGAVERSRRVFWKLLVTLILVGLITIPLQALTEGALGGPLVAGSEFATIAAALVVAMLASPLAYVTSSVVLGQRAPIDAVKESVQRFRERPAAALVVAIFEYAAQFLTLVAFVAAIEVVAWLAVLMVDLGLMGLAGEALTAAAILALVFAAGTLLFTLTAISLAPQVVVYLALTRSAPGLDSARSETASGREFRWLTRPFRVLTGVAVLALIAGHVALAELVA